MENNVKFVDNIKLEIEIINVFQIVKLIKYLIQEQEYVNVNQDILEI